MNRFICFVSLFALMAGSPAVVSAMHASDGPEFLIHTGKVFNLSLRGSAGILNGTAWETVYDNSPEYPETKGYKVSELIWDLKDLYMGGGVASVTLLNRLHFNAGYWLPMNEGSGQMEDYDWLKFQWGSDWTDWSLSDVDVTAAHMMDLNFSADILKFKGARLKGLVGYKEDYWEWKDHGIRHIYSTASGFRDDVGEDDYTTGIEYEQTFKMPYFGAGLDYAYKQFSVNAYFAYSPWVKADDRDYHVYREVLFTEDFSNGEYFGMGIKGTYAFKNGLFLSVSADQQRVPEIMGDTTIVAEGVTEFYPESAGIQHDSTMYSVSMGFGF
ncbi:MAG: omptin family outer membrane protease [Lentisphaerota bacterium]